jgi:endoglucanase
MVFVMLAVVSVVNCTPVKHDSPSDFVIGKGTNLAHWLSQSRRRGEERSAYIQEMDLEYIAGLGFEHVRLPIDEEQMWDEQGNRHEEAFGILKNCIDWSIKHDLRVIVDLHILRSHHFNAAEKPLWTEPEEQERFCDLWRDLSAALHKYPLSRVAYELMNEAVADDPDDWNQLLARCFAAIRETEPERLIVIGSNRWQSASTFDELKVPDDPNIILSYHFYEPFLLTHYHASWTGLRDYTGPVHYPGVILTQEEFDTLPENIKQEARDWIGRAFNKQVMTDMMEKPIRKAKELNLPLYCGEYGVLQEAPEADRLRWYIDMMQIFSENKIGSANWNYKSNQFGLVNNDGSRNDELIEIITGQ